MTVLLLYVFLDGVYVVGFMQSLSASLPIAGTLLWSREKPTSTISDWDCCRPRHASEGSSMQFWHIQHDRGSGAQSCSRGDHEYGSSTTSNRCSSNGQQHITKCWACGPSIRQWLCWDHLLSRGWVQVRSFGLLFYNPIPLKEQFRVCVEWYDWVFSVYHSDTWEWSRFSPKECRWKYEWEPVRLPTLWCE